MIIHRFLVLDNFLQAQSKQSEEKNKYNFLPRHIYVVFQTFCHISSLQAAATCCSAGIDPVVRCETSLT